MVSGVPIFIPTALRKANLRKKALKPIALTTVNTLGFGFSVCNKVRVLCMKWGYRENSKIWDTSNNCHNCPKNRKVWRKIALMHPKDADGMANSVDPDQTASSEAVWSWSALFAETYLSQYIELVRYLNALIFGAIFNSPIPPQGRTASIRKANIVYSLGLSECNKVKHSRVKSKVQT